jgi:hypothetical protein
MGVFSTLEINPPLFCPYCGEQHKSTQTYSVGYCEYYKIGDKAKSLEGNNNKYIIHKNDFICFGKEHDAVRSKALNLGMQTYDPKGNPYNTYPMFSFSCFKDEIYLGTVLNLDDALLLLDHPEDDEYELVFVY